MHSIKRKLVAALMVVAMVVSSLATALPAFAVDENATLTISGSGIAGGGETPNNVYAYQMFSVKNTSGEGEDLKVTYELNSQFAGFFTSDEKYGCQDDGGNPLTGEELSQAAYAYVSSMASGDTGAIATFAGDAADWVLKNPGNLNKLKGTVSAGAEGNLDTAKFSNLDYGYYLVCPLGSTGSKFEDVARGTYAMLVNVVEQNVAATIKSEYPTVDKEIIETPTSDQKLENILDPSWEEDHDMVLDSLNEIAEGNKGGSANVGDVLTFKLTSSVPDMSDFNTSYTFKFIDTLSEGLELLPNTTTPDVAVQIGTTVLKDSDFTATATPGVDDTTVLTVDLSSYLFENKNSLKIGDAISVVYQAKLTEDANLAEDQGPGNTNSVKVEFSNDPTTDSTGTSTPDQTHTYTFGFTINKEDDKGTALLGAKFKIYRDTGNGTFGSEDEVLTFKGPAGTALEVYMLAETQKKEGTVIITTANDFKVCGLVEGTYWVEEVSAPEGYNKLAKPMKVVIDGTYNADGILTGHTIQYFDAEGQKQSADHPNHSITIVNKAGALLPETGGMGTVIFTIVGVAVVAGGAVWLVQRNRRSNTPSGSHMA